ncbi:MAG: hypothetical protein HQM11_12415 [SAR324 cluster bacterium]|nr:hypothetical protein [SAR324 cluster bacterium]
MKKNIFPRPRLTTITLFSNKQFRIQRYFSIAGFVLLSFWSGIAHAEPEMIRHDYFSCMACHYSPHGGGLLTPYGRGIAQALSYQGGDYEESELKQKLSFDGLMDQGVQVRLAALTHGEIGKAFPMQGDYLNHTQLNDNLSLNVNIGEIPPPAGSDYTFDQEFLKQIILRKFVVSYRPGEDGTEITFGRDLLPVGLGLDDHTYFIKKYNRLNVNDVVTQLGYYSWGPQLLYAIVGYAPSTEESEGNGEAGGVLSFEYKPMVQKNYSFGGHVLKGRTDAISRTLTGLMTRLSFSESIVILAELDHTQRELADTGLSFGQWTRFLKASYYPMDYLETALTMESLERETPFEAGVSRTALRSTLRATGQLSFIFIFQNQFTNDTASNLDNMLMLQVFYNGF